MLDRASLAPEAYAYLRRLPLCFQLTMHRSPLTFRTPEDILCYEAGTLSISPAPLTAQSAK